MLPQYKYEIIIVLFGVKLMIIEKYACLELKFNEFLLLLSYLFVQMHFC